MAEPLTAATILDTAEDVLRRFGPVKASVVDVARALDISHGSVYRHFASKAQMYEGLIEFIETSLFGVINQISAEEAQGLQQVEHILALLLNFAQRNRGMTKVLTGDALVNENERLQVRINQLHDKIEAALKRGVRVIPVLVENAAMPQAEELPDSLRKLARRQGIAIDHARFNSDVERLLRVLSEIEEEARRARPPDAPAAAKGGTFQQVAPAGQPRGDQSHAGGTALDEASPGHEFIDGLVDVCRGESAGALQFLQGDLVAGGLP